VIDAYSVKPLDTTTINLAARDTQALITVEDHWIDGGLGDAVTANIDTRKSVIRLAVDTEPHSGTQEQLLRIHGISRDAIRDQVMDLVNHMKVSVA
jgi:transketolase